MDWWNHWSIFHWRCNRPRSVDIKMLFSQIFVRSYGWHTFYLKFSFVFLFIMPLLIYDSLYSLLCFFDVDVKAMYDIILSINFCYPFKLSTIVLSAYLILFSLILFSKIPFTLYQAKLKNIENQWWEVAALYDSTWLQYRFAIFFIIWVDFL